MADIPATKQRSFMSFRISTMAFIVSSEESFVSNWTIIMVASPLKKFFWSSEGKSEVGT